jgi:tripartite-type tricarboxylate transporter receptor subunit TctC
MRIIPGACLLLASGLLAIPASGAAQSWPERPVRLIIPLGAGSATDIVGRLYADKLTKRWGQPVVVDNRPGGDLTIGVAGLIEARDNHTLLLSVAAPITVNPLTHEKLAYDPSDLLPISQASEVSVGIAVTRSLQVDTLDQLVALARLQPGKLSWAATPGGTYLTFAGFQGHVGLSALNVPYRDIVQAQNDLAEARIDIMMCAISIVLPSVLTGKVKLLAVTNRQRAAIAPEVPTVDEAGYPVLALDGLVGFFGRRGMTDELRERISTDIQAVAADPSLANRLAGTGQVLRGSTPAEFAGMIEKQRIRFAEIARAIGMKPGQ